MQEIGLKLKSLRKAKRLTQQEVAERFGLSRTTISNYEIGRRKPTINVGRKPLMIKVLIAPYIFMVYNAFCINTPLFSGFKACFVYCAYICHANGNPFANEKERFFNPS